MNESAAKSSELDLAKAPLVVSWARVTLGRAGTYFIAVLTAFVIAGAVMLWAIARTGSLGPAIALLEGDQVYASATGPVLVDTTRNPPGGSVSIEFWNLTSQRLRIVGYDNPCSCFNVDNLPVQLEGSERKRVDFSVGGPSLSKGEIQIVFLTDSATQQQIPIRLKIQPKNDPQQRS